MFNPVSTYRIQFHKGFTFADLEKIIPYLQGLGIKTIYASPVFQAVPGSAHGYDSVNPLVINPEIGTIEQLKDISRRLKKAGISWLQDIVPNHMAFHPDNTWLMDVLEKGPLSLYKGFFDQSLSSELFKGPIMVPFLGTGLKEVINTEELKVVWNNGRFSFKYAEQLWPIKLASYPFILQAGEAKLTSALKQIITQAEQAIHIADADAFLRRSDEIKLQISSLLKNKPFNTAFKASVQKINGDKQQLHQLATQQHYRLCSWQETDHQINFRRFFTVNGLICLNIQHQEVFDQVHRLIGSLLQENVFQGLRIDHIDGLYDPLQYLERLRAFAGPDTYIVAEKILEHEEQLPDWPIQGSTGYDFLALVNNLFTNSKNAAAFTDFYQRLTKNKKPVNEQILAKKELILTSHMGGELENLASLFLGSGFYDKAAVGQIPAEEMKQAIGRFLIHCPVYRYYGNRFPLGQEESRAVNGIFKSIIKDHPDLEPAVNLMEDVLLNKPAAGDQEHNNRALYFYQRCMQFTGPLMAKGVEDTLMYTYNPFIGHNEVGDAPDAFGLSVKKYHRQMVFRQQQWPLALNATATHDTKRGEGARARLNVLTSIADEWLQTVTDWQNHNTDIKTNGAPDANDEYFIYQTLVATYPMPGGDNGTFEPRLIEYLEKMLREAKRHSDWAEPNEDYEAAVISFARSLLNRERPFWISFEAFYQKVCEFGIINSLAQTVLKLTCPGVPDIYQGCELWDLSMVDPDNRRPVNYGLRGKMLADTNIADEKHLGDLWKNRLNGQIKLWVINRLLKVRAARPDLFLKGDYVPLQIKGRYKDHLMAFARVFEAAWIIVVIPLDLAMICKPQQVNAIDWDDTGILIPEEAPENWESILSDAAGIHQHQLQVAGLFTDIPLAVIKLQKPDNKRSTGILMHITSLPSRFGIGDLGPQAKKFADILHRCSQKYWQLLPLNPTEAADAHSPYSSYSSHAGNTLLISPQLLVKDGLLQKADLKQVYVDDSDRVEFDVSAAVKQHLLDKAWNNFIRTQIRQDDFIDFCKRESYWINDFALYVVLKRHHNNNPWYQWEEKFKRRDEKALAYFSAPQQEALEKVKWLQYLFAKQWLGLKDYCNSLGVKIFGDLPFYISYDSADVWADPEIFSLDEKLDLKYVCGVPPDYFNENGQRWGMPVFNWQKVKETGYDWWIKRIRKNLEWYDLLRLDHFRAFAAYWEIPAEEATAKNGKWVPGPGSDFFYTLKKEFKTLPFVAEDLGDIDEAVHDLRKKFDLPGMKVLQFAFGEGMPQSGYIPHHHAENYLVYTGTHDNNTTLGWFKSDADKTMRKNLSRYAGFNIGEHNVSKALIKMAMASVCKTAIIPIQDLYNLDESARMNTPAADNDNWSWKLTRKQLSDFPEKKLKKWTRLFNR